MNKLAGYWVLAAVLLLVFSVSIVAQLPASLFLGKAQGIEGQLRGTIWNAKADALRVRSQVVRDVSLVVDFWPLLTGTVSGSIKTNGSPFDLVADFEKNGRHLTLQNYQARLQKPTTLYGQTFLAQSDVQGDMLMLDGDKCVDGQFSLSTNLAQKLAENLGVGAPILSGSGVCENGELRLMLQGVGAIMGLDVTAYTKASSLQADIVLTPKTEALPVHVHQLLTLAGLQFDGQAYKGQVQLKS